MLWNVRVDGCAPLVILRVATSYNVEVELLDLTPNGANVSITHRAVIDVDNGSNLSTSSAEEDFVSGIKLCAINRALARGDAKFTLCQLHDSVARDAKQNIFSGGWRDQFTI